MPYCVGCGFELQQDWNACANCGKLILDERKKEIFNPNDEEYYTLGKTMDEKSQRNFPKTPSPYDIVFKDKSPGIAVLLSIIIPGAGHLYTERIIAGLFYLFLTTFASVLFIYSSEEDFVCSTVFFLLFYMWIVLDVLTPGRLTDIY